MTFPVELVKRATAEEFLEILRPRDQRWGVQPARWIFRGQWDASLSLLPSAYRPKSWIPFAKANESPFEPSALIEPQVQAQQEFGVLKSFLDGADREALDIPNDIFIRGRFQEEDGSDTEFLLDPGIATFAALAQHHGIPTRLLDWTRVGLHAAYFSASDAAKHRHESGELSVWALSTGFVEQVQAIEERAGTPETPPRLRIVTAPRASNANLHAQAGLFTVWWNIDTIAALDDVVPEILYEREKDASWSWGGGPPLVRIDLPWSESPKLLRLLSYEQVDAARMFPGHRGVVRAIKERGLWDRGE